jgi:hypothetical protein
LSHPGTATAVDSARTVQIVEASWTRIQITIRLRPTDGRPLDATSILLRRSEQPPGEDGGFAPTHASQAGPDAVIRVNVIFQQQIKMLLLVQVSNLRPLY